MATPPRIAVQIPPQHATHADLRKAVLAAEETGVDVVFTWDHFYPLSGNPEGNHFECWTLLSSWAEITDRVELGHLVTCNSYRNPDLLADMARTIDHISDGRLVLGIGAGWFQRDYDEYGYEFGTPGSRLADLAEALPRIKARWTKLKPLPTRDIPIVIGGGGERKTLRLTAEYANTWHGFGDVATLTHKRAVLDNWCKEIGRNPDEIERSTSTRQRPDDVAKELTDAGISMIVVPVGAADPDDALALTREWVAWRNAQLR